MQEKTRRKTELIRIGVYVLCFIGVFIHLIEYDNSVFQTGKNTQNLIALLFFSIIILTAQKARLFSVFSLIVTVIYVPLAFLQSRMFCAYTPDLSEYIVLEKVVIWILLMTVTDMIVTKRIRDISRINRPMFVLFVVMVLLMVLLRGERLSVLNYICVFVFVLVSISENEWKRITGCILAAGFLSFVLVLILSFTLNPPRLGERWYGYFLNIGAFGEYLALITALAVISIILSKDKYGRLSIGYIGSWIWLLLVLATEALNGTTTYLVGLFVLIITLLVFGFGKPNRGKLFIRIETTILLMGCGLLLFLFASEYAINHSGLSEQLNANDSAPIIRIVLTGFYKVVEKIAGFRDSINGERADYIQSSVLTFLHAFSSRRIGIFEKYLGHTSFLPNSGGIWYHGYFAFGAHSQFIQVLYEYGFLAGGLNILFYLSLWITSIAGYVREKKNTYLIPMVVLSVMLGIWTGEVCSVNYPITFISLILSTFVIINPLPVKQDSFIKSLKGSKKLQVAAITLAMGTLVVVLLFAIKLVTISRKDVQNTEAYIVLSEKSDETSFKNTSGFTLFSQDYVLERVKYASWGKRGYAVVPFTGIQEGDSLVLEFTAVTDNPKPVNLKVCYENEEGFVTVSQAEEKFVVLYRGWPEDNTLVFIVEGQDGLDAPVIISNIRLTDYGQEMPDAEMFFDATEIKVYQE